MIIPFPRLSVHILIELEPIVSRRVFDDFASNAVAGWKSSNDVRFEPHLKDKISHDDPAQSRLP